MAHLSEDEPAIRSWAAGFITGALADHVQFACSDASLLLRVWRLAGGRGTSCYGHQLKYSSFSSLFPDCHDRSHILPLIQLQPSLFSFFHALFLCWHSSCISLCTVLAKPAAICNKKLWFKGARGQFWRVARRVFGSLNKEFTTNATPFFLWWRKHQYWR